MSISKNIYRKRGTGSFDKNGYKLITINGKQVREHLWIAEKALGRRLPEGVKVHHIDRNRANNEHSNLVICKDQKYHLLLHTRQKAFDACGDANWRNCARCKEYEDPKNMRIHFRRDGGINYYTHVGRKYGESCKYVYVKGCDTRSV